MDIILSLEHKTFFIVKSRTVVFIILAIIIADQALKVWVKTHMLYHEQIFVIKPWFRLFFIENEGMAWGWKFGGEWGKMALTLFRLVAVVFGVFYIRDIVKKNLPLGFIACVGMIFAGALGNLIDSLFYGMIFSGSELGMPLASLFPEGGGYAGFLHGRVVDMLYMPVIDDKLLPSWIPIWGGERFTFFSPIFNIADASISIGVIAILIFQKKFFKKHPHEEPRPTVEPNNRVNDPAEVA
ncbi:MAG: lipoprotein signal peptidase [Chitinophagaceae bacterium]|nr:lipoprotein signal peptidase [Chitinophagaceae bacterium]